MLEVEIKYRAADWDRIEAVLRSWGATQSADREEVDTYYAAPDRDLAETDEVVRLRRVGADGVLTYKGPKFDADTKTRPEVEVPLKPGPAAAEAAEKWLAGLRYTPVAVVRKRRRVYAFTRAGQQLAACLDDAGPVGRFIELEALAEPDGFPAAKAAVLQAAAELGLTEVEPRSYLRMTLELPQQT